MRLANITRHVALLARIAEDLGEPSCLVNIAGVTSLQRGDVLDLGPQRYDRTLGIDLRAAFFILQHGPGHFIVVADGWAFDVGCDLALPQALSGVICS